MFGPLMAGGLLAAACIMPATAPATPPRLFLNAVAVSSSPAPEAASSVMPARGQSAPDFVYQSHDHLWQNLHNMLEEHHVLLVFGAGADDLARLEREREALQRLGIAPVAVVHQRDGEARRLVRDLDLGYSLLADPRGAIGEQYGVRDLVRAQDRAVWFVIDRGGAVRDLGEGLVPGSGWQALAAGALELPPAAITATD